ncbi:hypothetical protein H310_13039 [Aphanomyces invadans]|uniref:Uncharacterized protein n=1 Tax=Aphanomyces invadans TaxID=157072 RepID=A0A024TFN1_9STRA|nr:hypothetical protein H310_13039 [Aphanomyces invadans]ETV92848.1 hypothetical protein H310_13039 [Aphanomyces invadans]|eukprot:XP_008878618.1 hypothetical protein H310_13039 [Aphanomyces invadans]
MADQPPAAATPLPPQGSFTVVVGNVRVANSSNNQGEPSPSFWASVDAVTGSGDSAISSAALWWASTPDTAARMNTPVLTVQHQAVEDEDDDPEPQQSFRYAQPSKLFTLTDAALIPQLCATVVRVSLYKGIARDKDVDVLVKAVDVPLRPLVVAIQVDKTIAFSDDVSVQVGVSFDVAFAEYFKGAKALSVVSLTIRHLPQEWKLVAKEGEDVVVLAASPDTNPAKYMATIALPGLGGINGAETMPSVTLALEGKLEVDNSNRAADTEGATTESPANVDGMWQVSLKPTDPTQLWFLTKDQANLCLEWIEGQAKAAIAIQRIQPGTDPWTASSSLSLATALVPGTEMVCSIAPLGQGVAPTRESLEEALAKATTNDDKKKAQAALNDFDNVLSRIAGQAASYVSAGATCHVECVLLPGPWIPVPPVPTPPAMSLQELIPPRAPLPPFPQRDAQVSMHKELRKVVSMLMKEYDKLFLQSTDDDRDDDDEEDECPLSKEDRRQKLIFHLNAEGLYFDFKEKLKKALVAVIREKFPTLGNAPSPAPPGTTALGALAPPQRQHKADFYAQLYTYLMEEVHVVMNGVFHGAEVHEAHDESPDAIRTKLATMKLQAWEREVNGQLKKATTSYTDRVDLASKYERDLPDLQAPVWFEFALFYLRTQDLTKAGECLRQCLAIDATHVGAVQAYGALLCQNREFDAAEIVLKNALLISPAPNATHQARTHGLLGLFYSISKADATGNLRLHELMQATAITKCTATFSSPTAECIAIAAYCKDLGLFSLAHDALALGDAVTKPKTVLSTAALATQKLVRGAIELHVGNFVQGRQWCQDGLDVDPDFADGWYVHGLLASRQNDLAVALSSYGQALGRIDKLHDMYRLPLFLQLGALYMHHQQWGPAKAIFLRACHETTVASAWLGVGVVSVRQDDWEGAEMALAEANILDRTNADVWGYLTLVCLNATPPRLKEAEQALEQALRYGLENTTLLRELSNGFVAQDKLEVAESLLRRSLLTGDSSITRKTLADVLAAQNCASTALEQYKKALEGCDAMSERATLLNQCANLLSTLGRLEEAKEYRDMARHQQEGADNEALMGRQVQQRVEVES